MNPIKLAYRGVLIERPCVNCDTVDIHMDGKCNSGPCQFVTHLSDRGVFSDIVCGKERFTTRPSHGTWGHDYMYGHEWVPSTYYPADIEFPCTCGAAVKWHNVHHPYCASFQTARAFHSILDKVKEIGQPEYYTCDLFRDYQRITGQNKQFPTPALRFVWAVRHHGCGTDLFTPETGISHYYDDNPHMAYFLYDGLTHGPLGDFVGCNLATARTVLSTWRSYELAPVGGIPA